MGKVTKWLAESPTRGDFVLGYGVITGAMLLWYTWYIRNLRKGRWFE